MRRRSRDKSCWRCSCAARRPAGSRDSRRFRLPAQGPNLSKHLGYGEMNLAVGVLEERPGVVILMNAHQRSRGAVKDLLKHGLAQACASSLMPARSIEALPYAERNFGIAQTSPPPVRRRATPGPESRAAAAAGAAEAWGDASMLAQARVEIVAVAGKVGRASPRQPAVENARGAPPSPRPAGDESRARATIRRQAP